MNILILITLNLIHFQILKYFSSDNLSILIIESCDIFFLWNANNCIYMVRSFDYFGYIILVLYQNKYYVQLISNDVAMSHDNDDDLSDLLSQKYISPFNDFYMFKTTIIKSWYVWFLVFRTDAKIRNKFCIV